MPNNYFKFKQFIIEQDKCAMKVGTDGVLLGAWANCNSAKNILDIGTGTGLIALMLAQRSDANIDAVEIDEPAYTQATENVKRSNWNSRMLIYHSSFQDYIKSCQKKYDLIVTNPPYFTNSLHAPEYKRTIARHNSTLPFNELIKSVSEILSTRGKFRIIVPTDAFTDIKKLAIQSKLYIYKMLWVKPNSEKDVKRVLIEFSKLKSEINEKTLVIEKGERHDYTDEYIELTKKFYLAF